MRADSGGWGARGNQVTCALSGFWNQFQCAVPLYNGSLAVYFFLHIYHQRNRSSATLLLRWVEPWLHGIPVTVGLVTSVLGLSQGWYNAQAVPEVGCWIENYPYGCQFSNDVPCTRGPLVTGHDHDHLVLTMSFIPLMGGCVMVFLANLLIFAVVLRQECKTHFYEVQWRENSQNDWRRMGVSSSSNNIHRRYVRQVVFQNLLYVLVMFNTVVWILLADIATYWGHLPERFIFPLYQLYCLTFPGQGFWNFLVYIRPQYIVLRRKHKMSRLRAVWCAVAQPIMKCPTNRQQDGYHTNRNGEDSLF